MKKLSLAVLSALLVSGCAEKEQYEEVVLEQMQKEQDVKDYNLDPEQMAKCVVDTTSSHMPGAFSLDPDRLAAYRNYTKMLTLDKSEDPKKTLAELRNDFGSAKALSDAHSNYTESMVSCYSAVINRTESTTKKPEAKPDQPESKPEEKK